MRANGKRINNSVRIGHHIAALTALALGVSSAGGSGHGEPAKKPAAPAASAPAAAPTTQPAGGHAAAPSLSTSDVLKLLADGNARYTAGKPARPNQNQARRDETVAGGQHPYAAVLSCADSRVPPELLFDAGIGDLFVVRVAGNVADVDEIGTIEYGVEHLGIGVIVVLGHTKCGAVTAVVDHAHVTPNIAKLVDNIEPAAEETRKSFPQLSGARLVDKAIRVNVRQSMADLVNRSELIRDRVKAGKVRIAGGVYDLKTGEVDWLESAPIVPAVPSATTPATDPHTPAASAGHDSHGATDARGAPASHGHEPDVHPAAGGHDEKPAKGHEKSAKPADVHSAEEAKDPHAAATETKGSKDNLLVFGGLLGAAGVTSGGIFYFMKARSRSEPEPSHSGPAIAAAPAPAETPPSPATAPADGDAHAADSHSAPAAA